LGETDDQETNREHHIIYRRDDARHACRFITTLSDAEIIALWTALRGTLPQSIDQGGSAWEQNLYGEKGQWDQRFMHILHLEEQPCPVCGTIVENIKTGSTHTRICPVCQPL
jgi:formamidopyrimidine-DNA glycosylase